MKIFIILWFLIGFVSSCMTLYVMYREGTNILYNDICYFILYTLSGPIATLSLTGYLFKEYGKKVLIKGKNKEVG